MSLLCFAILEAMTHNSSDQNSKFNVDIKRDKKDFPVNNDHQILEKYNKNINASIAVLMFHKNTIKY